MKKYWTIVKKIILISFSISTYLTNYQNSYNTNRDNNERELILHDNDKIVNNSYDTHGYNNNNNNTDEDDDNNKNNRNDNDNGNDNDNNDGKN